MLLRKVIMTCFNAPPQSYCKLQSLPDSNKVELEPAAATDPAQEIVAEPQQTSVAAEPQQSAVPENAAAIDVTDEDAGAYSIIPTFPL